MAFVGINRRERAAQAVVHNIYRRDAIKNYMTRDESGIVRDLLGASGDASFPVESRGRVTWYLRNELRAGAGYAHPTTYAVDDIAGREEQGVELACTMDEFVMRAEIGEYEYTEGDSHKYFNSLAKLEEDFADAFNQIFPSLALNNGDGVLGNYTGAGVTIASAASGTYAVDDVNKFHKGMIFESIASDGSTVEGTFRVTGMSVRYGAGNLTVLNIGSSSATVAASATARLIRATTAGKGHGLNYIIDDGTNNTYYPRQISNSGNTSLDRTSPAYADSLQAIRINKADAKIDWSVFDQVHLELWQRNFNDIFMHDGDYTGTPNMTYRCVMRPEHMTALQVANRAAGLAYRIGLGHESENMGLKRPVYGNLVFAISALSPVNTLLFPRLDQLAAKIGNPIEVPMPWHRRYGYLTRESIRRVPWQVIATSVAGMVRVDNVTGQSYS